MSSPLRRLGTGFSEAHGLVLQSEVFHGDIRARMTRVSLTAKVANVDDLVCASSVSARDIRHPVWLCLRFTLSYRDVDDLLAERGLDVSYESVGRSLLKFGPLFAREFPP